MCIFMCIHLEVDVDIDSYFGLLKSYFWLFKERGRLLLAVLKEVSTSPELPKVLSQGICQIL